MTGSWWQQFGRRTPAPRRPPGRPDASMTLLTEVMERPLDPSYAASARARVAAGEPAARSVNTSLAVTAAAVVGLLLAVGAVQLREPSPGETRARAVLISEIERRSNASDATGDAIAGLRAQIDDLQAAALGPGDDSIARAEQLAISTGAVAVNGPGLRITLDDAPTEDADPVTGDRPQTADDDGRVQDRDLQIVTNGLWAAGAEGIAINGQRLTALAAIRGAGQAILVDYRPLSPPYVVEAVGDPATLEARFAATPAGPYVTTLLRERYGIETQIETVDEIGLPSSGTLSLRSARVTDGPDRSGQTGAVPEDDQTATDEASSGTRPTDRRSTDQAPDEEETP